MRILYFAPTSTLYGDNIALLNILSVLKMKGLDFCIITSEKGDFTDKLDKLGYTYHIQPFYVNLYPPCKSVKDIILFIPRILRGIIMNNIYTKRITSFVKNYSPDIIHTNNGLVSTGYVIAKKLNIPHVWHLREYGKLDVGRDRLPNHFLFKKMLRSSHNYNFYITNAIAKYMGKELSNTEKDVVIYDGVLREDFSVFCKSKMPVFLFVGRLVEAKGVMELLYAFTQFIKHNKNYTLQIAGIGDERYIRKLNQVINENQLDEHVFFLGHKKQDEIYKLMQTATALVVPSRSEGFGFITTEAMFNGCLVIGKDTGGTKEQFDNGLKLHGKEIGIRYDNHEELVNALFEVEKNGIEYYSSMIERAYETVCSLYTIEQSAEKVYDYYLKILKNYEQ